MRCLNDSGRQMRWPGLACAESRIGDPHLTTLLTPPAQWPEVSLFSI